MIDGLGALLSASILGIVLLRFEGVFGMPVPAIWFLFVTACALAIFSLTCCLFVQKGSRSYLRIIAFTNLEYGCITTGLVLYYFTELTGLGLLYFLLEVAVIATLAIIELKSASALSEEQVVL